MPKKSKLGPKNKYQHDYCVERLINSRKTDTGVELLVKYKGLGHQHNSWIPQDQFKYLCQTSESTKNAGPSILTREVEHIEAVQTKRDKSREFLVKWKGFDSYNNSWVLESDLNSEAINEFEQHLEKSDLCDDPNILVEYNTHVSKAGSKKQAVERHDVNYSKEKLSSNSLDDSAITRKNNGEEQMDEMNDTDNIYEAEKILSVRQNKTTGSVEYLVKWKEFSSCENSWEQLEAVKYTKALETFLGQEEYAALVGVDDIFEVECIVDHRPNEVKGGIDFLIKWKNYSSSQNSWEHESRLYCNLALKRYLKNVNKNL